MTRRPDGALEHDVLTVLWDADSPLSPAEINERLAAGHAYTSIATVLTRLHTKGLVTRTVLGRGYVYAATVDESELAVRRIGELLDASSDRTQVLARFLGGLSSRELTTIRTMLDSTRRPDDST